ncbi:nucleotide exchange factor GrpE [Isoptericola sp. b441]|uniref:Protein GrpE n=1 Tax=Actinotalea lenta TaxID=3064654 RepID=A0ABT9D642_9CELL|nr:MULTISPECIES: nucleotide exchange factor GrpE [unclassified Isoptericola]MDO8106293.1 nucleotide exchange factor GrpE [Isoptericola sp. b441]MDO8121987.1 nucleotide exchange factor GrpE [Isoptericola sp. b490]
MSDQPTNEGGTPQEPPPRFTDKRRIDPTTGEVRAPADEQSPTGAAAAGPVDGLEAPEGEKHPVVAALEAAEQIAGERLEDLQRLQAEFVNYRKRVERDRLVARDQTVVAMVEAMLGVLDDIDAARTHDELTGPFGSVAEKLETTLGRFGWERYGAAGEPFDPNVHEALMHAHSDDVTEPTVVQVLQAGHRVGERIVRAARVAVAEPE